MDPPTSPIQSLIDRLRTPIDSLQSLQTLLTAPLAALALLPPQFHSSNSSPLPPHALSIQKHIPQIQRLLLTHIAPTWAPELARETGNQESLLTAYFVPDVFYNARPAAGDIARLAYGTLVSTPLTEFGLKCLDRLVVEYPVDRLYRSVYGDNASTDKRVQEVQWEDCVRDICMVPGKVANSLAERARTETPENLENGVYFGCLSERVEVLISELAAKDELRRLDALAYLLTKLVNVGLFPSRPPVARSQPSFFVSTLPSIRTRLDLSTPTPSAYSAFWHPLFLALPSSLTLQSILASLFGTLVPTLESIDPPTDGSTATRSRVRSEAALLQSMVGGLSPEGDTQALWEVATSIILDREWPEAFARVFVAWISGGACGGTVDLEGIKVLEAFMEVVLEQWASPEHIKHSLISRHRYTTALFLLSTSYFPSSSSPIPPTALVSNATFITGISAYLAHLDPAVRRCGMLAAEVVAHRAGKKLDFGDWEGEGQGRAWCRALRTLLETRDIDAALLVEEKRGKEDTEEVTEVEEIATPGARTSFTHETPTIPRTTTTIPTSGYDSDDSLTGYASPASSRSASPTPSTLAELEADPTLNIGRKPVPRPVYLAQLSPLLRGSTAVGSAKGGGPDDPHEADRMEMGLNVAEELIRRKAGYGTELGENAVDLVFVLLGMSDNYEIEGFDEKRQGALRALVVGAPTKAAPALIQEFFKNQYSVEQRFVALNALALGARELASLSVPPSRIPTQRTLFPSKTLPAPLHHKYLSAARAGGHTDTSSLPQIMDDISKLTLDKERTARDSAPEIVRERRLRLQKPRAGVTELPPTPSDLNPYSTLQPPLPRPATRFIDVAAAHFIMPFINAFWAFLRDEQAREARTAFQPAGRGRYHGAGTGLVLSPMVLAQFMRTLAILVHAAQLAPEWLAIVAPEALELAVTVGTRPVSHTEVDDAQSQSQSQGQDGANPEEDRQAKEASVLTASLELALVILDGALELDGGRILGLEHTTLVLGLREWAEKVFAGLERGLRVQGGGGVHEVKLSRAAAGVLLKVDELMGRWSRSMLDTR